MAMRAGAQILVHLPVKGVQSIENTGTYKRAVLVDCIYKRGKNILVL
jgi:hypothetical protein